jgi:uncharacterized protein YpmS
MDNNFNSQSDNSSDWKSNSRQKNKSRTGSKSKLSVLTIVLLVTAIASIIANIVLLVTDSKRTADTVARIEDKDIETARNTEKDDMLNLIRSRFENVGVIKGRQGVCIRDNVLIKQGRHTIHRFHYTYALCLGAAIMVVLNIKA